MFNNTNSTIIISHFEKNHEFNIRKAESARIMAKHTDKLPIIAEPLDHDKLMKKQSDQFKPKYKFLVDHNLTIAQFHHILRKRLHLTQEDAIFIFSKNSSLPRTSESIGYLYNNDNISEDGFLYLFYGSEATFGK
jgi:GABA(A) receptor-associated protein